MVADLLGGGITETDPVFVASAAYSIAAADIADWNTAFGWGDHALAGYLTAYVESDPIWTAASNSYYQKTEAEGRFVDVAGDTMTGALTINDSASGALRIDSANNTVAIGRLARGGVLGVAGMYLMADFPAQDYLTAIAVGIVSGLAAVGVDQIGKQLNQ